MYPSPYFLVKTYDNITEPAPEGLHLPQFTYSTPTAPGARDGTPHPPSFNASDSYAYSQPFAFSALFLSSPGSDEQGSLSTPRTRSVSGRGRGEESFIGFTWGPKVDAFMRTSLDLGPQGSPSYVINTPRPSTPYLHPPFTHSSLPTPQAHKYSTPLRAPFTLPRSTVRSAVKRAVSDREAMKQLVDCVGMSARNKVLESGRKPRILTLTSLSGGGSSLKKELRFESRGATVNPGNESDFTESEGPPSPSPSPRPGSAMSVRSRRSATPTSSQQVTNTLSLPHPSQGGMFTSGTLDAMEGRYMSIMGDIKDMERRLEYLI